MVENNAFFKLSYGLFLLFANQDGKDNGCVINTAMQITDSPKQIIIAINKTNFTHDQILATKKFNLSVISTNAAFSLFEQFGFKSGRNTNKFDNVDYVNRSDNGLFYLSKFSNAFFSCKVIRSIDCITHTEFLAEVVEAKVLNDDTSMTYQYYFDNVKPKPENKSKKGWVCKICGYVYEGETLPDDFICPLCKHPASDFEKIE